MIQDSRPIAVLLATYNGVKHLPLQLESLTAQSWPRIDVWASDDGSTDETRMLLEAAAARWDRGRFVILDGPKRRNAAANFRQLVLSTTGSYDFVAFADQDDIWLPWKLTRAVEALTGRDELPCVHCARTQLIDEDGRRLGKSPHFTRPPSFRNALVQSLAGGNTMVLNRRAFSLLQLSSERTVYIAHDWWTYQITSAAGGQMIYSPVADTLYRQHSSNEVGANMGLVARLRRARAVFRGRFRNWNDQNFRSLDACRDLMTPSNRSTFDLFQSARSANFVTRLTRLRRSGVYRQTVAGHTMLYVAAALGLL